MSKKHIAMIYEGEKTERILIQNIDKHFFKGAELIPIAFPAGENLYMLWKQLEKDDFQTDVLEVLREYNDVAKKTLKDFTRTDFSEIYMFFDYDGHNDNLSANTDAGEVLKQMLEIFNNETDLGKLYINYPMVEALRDNLPPEIEKCYRRCCIDESEIKNYKNAVSDICNYQDFRKLSRHDWKYLCQNCMKKLNCIFEFKYLMPTRIRFLTEMTQMKLYEKQKCHFIDNKKIAIISSFPLFLLEYFKLGFWEEMLQDEGGTL